MAKISMAKIMAAWRKCEETSGVSAKQLRIKMAAKNNQWRSISINHRSKRVAASIIEMKSDHQ
jgi:hypothetical protein